jgi:hypothetical protein
MARVIITVTSTKDRDVKINGRSHSLRSGEPKQRPDLQVSDDDVEVVLHDSFKGVADIVRFTSMPSSRSLEKAAVKKRNSLDDIYSIDSDEETVEEWFDEIVEELLGVQFVPDEWREKASATTKMNDSREILE